MCVCVCVCKAGPGDLWGSSLGLQRAMIRFSECIMINYLYYGINEFVYVASHLQRGAKWAPEQHRDQKA